MVHIVTILNHGCDLCAEFDQIHLIKLINFNYLTFNLKQMILMQLSCVYSL